MLAKVKILAISTLMILSVTPQTFAESVACSVKTFLKDHLLLQERKRLKNFDVAQFNAYKVRFTNGEKIAVLPETLEAKAALFELLAAPRSEHGFDIEKLMTEGKLKKRRELSRDLDKLFSAEKKTPLGVQYRIENIYAQQLVDYDSKVLEDQVAALIETRMASQRVSQVLAEMKLIRDPKDYEKFIQKALQIKDYRRRIQMPVGYFEIAMRDGFDAAWDAGLGKQLIKENRSSLVVNAIRRSAVKGFMKAVHLTSKMYLIYYAGEEIYGTTQQIRLGNELSKEKQTTQEDLKDIESTAKPDVANTAFEDWKKQHPNASKEETEKYRKLIFGK